MQTISQKIVTVTAPPAKGRKLIFDSHKSAPRGFALKITPNNKRTFVLRYNIAGKDRLMTIGDYPTWSLAAARKRASELKREIDSGADVLEQRRERNAEATLSDTVDRWFKAHAGKLKSAGAIHNTINLHLLPSLGKKKIKDIRRRDVIALIEVIAATHGRQAQMVLTYTKQIFAWAEHREVIEANPVATLRASKISPDMAPNPRSRVLNDAEIATLWNADKIEGMSRATLLALKFILVTGQRPGEVCKAEQGEVCGNVWTIPKAHRGKTDDEHVVPLTDAALDLLQQAAGKRYLFERYQGNGMVVNALSKAVLRVAAALGNDTSDPWKPHDLRRTMRTGLAAAGISETVAELAVGHVRKGIAAVYDQHRYTAEKRAALEAWERRLLLIVDGKSPDDSKVVSIKSGAV